MAAATYRAAARYGCLYAERSMAERKQSSALAKTNIAKLRLEKNVSQASLAEATGLSVRTIQELERDTHSNPRIGYLKNIAIALEADLLDVCEPSWVAPLKFGDRLADDHRTTDPVTKARRDLGASSSEESKAQGVRRTE